ncbi:MAG: PLP-dependent aminotransferase family protein [Clostridia bacterium]|nr:PLP-dependent aminotransferase family protein [Clostridia bacterium]
MKETQKFADRVVDLKASAIREMFKLMAKGDVVALSGGAPAPESFPTEELAEISAKILREQGTVALQYSVTEGYQPLRDMVVERTRAANKLTEYDDTIITTGAQQAIDLAFKALVNDGEGIIVERPSFVGTLNSARSYRAKLYDVPVLDDGMDLDRVEQLLQTENIKLIYTIPTFQNPTGITMSDEKRQRLIDLAVKYDVYIVEDNPYGDLRFAGDPKKNIKSLDPDGRVIYCGTFSKILSPGLRIGWVSAHRDIIERIVVVKQANDVHTPIFNQMMAAEFMKQYDMDEHIARLCKLYGRKCGIMLDALDNYFPEGCTYTRPEGGLFLWCTLPEGTDTKELLTRCIERKVAFVPGNTCMVDIDAPTRYMRLNYSAVAEDKIDWAVKTMSDVIRESL